MTFTEYRLLIDSATYCSADLSTVGVKCKAVLFQPGVSPPSVARRLYCLSVQVLRALQFTFDKHLYRLLVLDYPSFGAI